MGKYLKSLGWVNFDSGRISPLLHPRCLKSKYPYLRGSQKQLSFTLTMRFSASKKDENKSCAGVRSALMCNYGLRKPANQRKKKDTLVKSHTLYTSMKGRRFKTFDEAYIASHAEIMIKLVGEPELSPDDKRRFLAFTKLLDLGLVDTHLLEDKYRECLDALKPKDGEQDDL